MFHRFSAAARRAFGRARQEAESLNQSFIGSEHLLLGILEGEDDSGALALRNLGVTYAELRRVVETEFAEASLLPAPRMGQLPFTPHALEVIHAAERCSSAHGEADARIDTGHLAYGISAVHRAVGLAALERLGHSPKALRWAVWRTRPPVLAEPAPFVALEATPERILAPSRLRPSIQQPPPPPHPAPFWRPPVRGPAPLGIPENTPPRLVERLRRLGGGRLAALAALRGLLSQNAHLHGALLSVGVQPSDLYRAAEQPSSGHETEDGSLRVEVVRDEEQQVALLLLSGALDYTHAAPLLCALLEELRAEGCQKVVLDLSKVRYVNSGGLGLLVKLGDLMHEGKGMALCRVPCKVKIVIEMLGLESFFALKDSLEEAWESLGLTTLPRLLPADVSAVVRVARREAERPRQMISTQGHLLLGLLAVLPGAGEFLRERGVSPDRLRAALGRATPPSADELCGRLFRAELELKGRQPVAQGLSVAASLFLGGLAGGVGAILPTLLASLFR